MKRNAPRPLLFTWNVFRNGHINTKCYIVNRVSPYNLQIFCIIRVMLLNMWNVNQFISMLSLKQSKDSGRF